MFGCPMNFLSGMAIRSSVCVVSYNCTAKEQAVVGAAVVRPLTDSLSTVRPPKGEKKRIFHAGSENRFLH